MMRLMGFRSGAACSATRSLLGLRSGLPLLFALVVQPPLLIHKDLSGYCSSVSGSSGPADLSDLPNIQIGPASCAGFGPFTIGLSSLNWLPGLSGLDNATIPSVELCFREIYFGSVTIFGMSFSLDILSAVISGILALRWLFRS